MNIGHIQNYKNKTITHISSQEDKLLWPTFFFLLEFECGLS